VGTDTDLISEQEIHFFFHSTNKVSHYIHKWAECITTQFSNSQQNSKLNYSTLIATKFDMRLSVHCRYA
jgi:hypothetical protein